MIKSIQSALKRNAIKYRLYYNKIPKKHTSPICWKIFKKNKKNNNWHSQRTDTNFKKQFKESIMCWCWNSQSSLVKKIKEQPRRKLYYYYLLIKPKTHQVTSLNKSRWKNLWCTTPSGFGSRALDCMWRLSYYYYYLLPESGLSISLLFLEEIENTRKTYLL